MIITLSDVASHCFNILEYKLWTYFGRTDCHKSIMAWLIFFKKKCATSSSKFVYDIIHCKVLSNFTYFLILPIEIDNNRFNILGQFWTPSHTWTNYFYRKKRSSQQQKFICSSGSVRETNYNIWYYDTRNVYTTINLNQACITCIIPVAGVFWVKILTISKA